MTTRLPRTHEQVAEAHADLYPPLSACLARDFFGYYQSNASSLTFEALYTNTGGLTDKFGAHGTLVARAVADAPNVLMHEVINEPPPRAGPAFEPPQHNRLHCYTSQAQGEKLQSSH